MGSALAQKFAQEGFKVILADREEICGERIDKYDTTLEEGVEKNVFTQVEITGYFSNLKGTANLSDLKVCDIGGGSYL